jgi:hypothetical protein
MAEIQVSNEGTGLGPSEIELLVNDEVRTVRLIRPIEPGKAVDAGSSDGGNVVLDPNTVVVELNEENNQGVALEPGVGWQNSIRIWSADTLSRLDRP